MIQAQSLRFRMMALFCVVVGVLLAASHLAFYVVLRREIRTQLDRQLMETSSPVAADLAADPDESDVTELNIPDEYFEVLDPSGHVTVHSRNLGPPSSPCRRRRKRCRKLRSTTFGTASAGACG